MSTLYRDLDQALARVPLIDPHSHINPHAPVSRSLEDILGYHYYTELAHSAGMPQTELAMERAPIDRIRSIMTYLEQMQNTAQYRWFLEIAQVFLGFRGTQLRLVDAELLAAQAEETFRAATWEQQVFAKTNLEKIFLTNEFDDPLTGFDTSVYVPCLRTDALVFQWDQPSVR
ncbi:MAG: glucuronate isomerase, partial [Gemmataceae bacterium]